MPRGARAVPAIFPERGAAPRHPMAMQPAPDTHPTGVLTQTDVQLLDRIRAGEPAAMEALMRRHNRILFRTARAILRDDAEAEDAVQDAYVQAYRSIHTFRGESKFSTWLVRIAAN